MTIASAAVPDTSRAPAATAMWRGAEGLLAAMPLGMAIAHRSAPLFLVLAAICALLALGRERRLEALLGDARQALSSPVGRSVLAFLGWCLVSLSWSSHWGKSLHALGEFWLSVAAAFVLSLVLPARISREAVWLLAGSLALACVIILAELQTGMTLRRSLAVEAEVFIFNRPVLTILVVSIPLLVWLAGAGRSAGLVGAGTGLLAMAAIGRSESGAAALALLVAAGVFAVACWAPRLTAGLAGLALLGASVSAPAWGLLADRMIPAALHQSLASSHSRERVDVWLSFGAVVREAPVLGAGFGVSARMHETPMAARVAPEYRSQLDMGHPHNAALQIWVELGAVGVLLALVVVLLGLRLLAGLPAHQAAPRLALMAAVAAASLVGHGAWQGWWAAAVGAALIWFRCAEQRQKARMG